MTPAIPSMRAMHTMPPTTPPTIAAVLLLLEEDSGRAGAGVFPVGGVWLLLGDSVYGPYTRLPLTATGLLRSVVVPSPCVRDGQIGWRESQLGNSFIQQHLAGRNTHSTSWPYSFGPQHMASPVESTRAHVW